MDRIHIRFLSVDIIRISSVYRRWQGRGVECGLVKTYCTVELQIIRNDGVRTAPQQRSIYLDHVLLEGVLADHSERELRDVVIDTSRVVVMHPCCFYAIRRSDELIGIFLTPDMRRGGRIMN